MANLVESARGATWLAALTPRGEALPGYPASVRVVDGELGGEPARFIAVVPDPDNRFPRARQGEVGLVEGWALARAVRECMAADAARTIDFGHITRSINSMVKPVKWLVNSDFKPVWNEGKRP